MAEAKAAAVLLPKGLLTTFAFPREHIRETLAQASSHFGGLQGISAAENPKSIGTDCGLMTGWFFSTGQE